MEISDYLTCAGASTKSWFGYAIIYGPQMIIVYDRFTENASGGTPDK